MKKGVLLLWAALAVFGLSSCSSHQEKSPDPRELMERIQEAVALPEMTDVAEDYLEMNTGIEAQSYDSAVYCLLTSGTGADEIAIIRGTDEEQADAIQEKLENRLDYKERSAQVYLTENMPVIQGAVIRRDGLTVSLIVSEQAEQIVEVYDSVLS